MNMTRVDYVVIGAGIYGLFAASFLGKRGFKVVLVEMDSNPLQRASYINQARVHNGYHYPRSVSTAEKSAQYFERFNQEFSFAVHSTFRKIYAISKNDSLTNAEQFIKFCNFVGIPAEEINYKKYFNEGLIESAYETMEFTYDATIIRAYYMDKLKGLSNVELLFKSTITVVETSDDEYILRINDNRIIYTNNVLNATYASINQIHEVFNVDKFKTKYELCEVILTKADKVLQNTGITLMDGPFFSIMPFGLSGYHSLTSVSYTPHETSNSMLPSFSCQSRRSDCTQYSLQNCNTCNVSPDTAWISMKQQTSKFLNPGITFEYKKSLYAVKTILNSAELDDSRPTVIRKLSEKPNFISVLSGKFNTIYDLEEVLL